MLAQLERHQPGETVTLTLWRGGQTRKQAVVLGKCLRRRTAAHGQALLQQRPRVAFRGGRMKAACVLSLALVAPMVATAADVKPGVAIFAGGCFWCVEADFDKVPGVLGTVSGYIGGSVPTPRPTSRCRPSSTGHAEAVRITLRHRPRSATSNCWRCTGRASTRPRADRQFCDSRGALPHAAIYAVADDAAAAGGAGVARRAGDPPSRSSEPIVTQIEARDPRSTRPRTTTRTTTGRTRSATSTTAPAAAATQAPAAAVGTEATLTACLGGS
jgi:peptide methionine sulfoxide reductase MsrA